MGTAKHYLFRVMSHGTDGTTVSTSDELKYDLPDNVKQKAVTAGLIGKIFTRKIFPFPVFPRISAKMIYIC